MTTCHDNPNSIVPGSYHWTRGGEKVFIQAVDLPFKKREDVYPVRGLILDDDEKDGSLETWRKDGYYGNDEDRDDLDLISEWKEPKKIIRWMATGYGCEMTFKTEQEAFSHQMRLKDLGDISAKKIMLIGYE